MNTTKSKRFRRHRITNGQELTPEPSKGSFWRELGQKFLILGFYCVFQ
ncbi:hypothetical protein [Calothrix sp. 336/3]|nr:hypothetical protein [Calothrix sp. 336/3]